MVEVKWNDEHILKRKFIHFTSHAILSYGYRANLNHEIML